MQENNTLAISPEERNIEIIPFGTDERIKLNVSIVQKMIAVPTKQGHIADAVSCMKFMMLCKARHLNPFEGDAYLIGYDTHTGPQFTLITAHQVFLKRAEASESFDGMQSGVIAADENSYLEGGGVIEREGDLFYEGETLVGGWAKVYRKDRKIPFYKRLKLSTFNTGRSRWEKDAAGMIVKCAEADALRTAFPTHLGGLYMKEELPPLDITPKAKSASEGIEFGPSGIESIEKTIAGEENEHFIPGTGMPLPVIPKRRRRTKAEMEAIREGQQASAEARTEQVAQTVEDAEHVMTGEPPDLSPPKKEAPPLATPLEGLRNLIKASPVDEGKFTRHLVNMIMLEPHQKLDDLKEDQIKRIIEDFMPMCATILDVPETQDKAPY